MIILGIDPGLASLGWGVIEKKNNTFHPHNYGVIKTSSKDTLANRLFLIAEQLDLLIQKYQPQVAGVENLYFAKNVSSALPVAHARGVILLQLRRKQVRSFDFDPNVIKQSVVGVGNAKKEQVQMMVKILLKLENIPKADHAADALAVAICAGQKVSSQDLYQ